MGGERLDTRHLWNEYVEGKQTYIQLAQKHGCSLKTIQRRLDTVRVEKPIPNSKPVVVLMDTTYFGRGFGLMLFKDAYTGINLHWDYVSHETVLLYKQGIDLLLTQGYRIKGLVFDGKRGVLNSFSQFPLQICQFHQIAIVRRYLTRNPKSLAGKALLAFSLLLTKTDKESFVGGLENWHKQWEAFLNERSVKIEGKKSRYTHRKLRSAYRSLATNLPWLFTWYDHIELKIPNTTNAIDGHFSDLKNKLRNHNGMSLKRKIKFIDEFLKA